MTADYAESKTAAINFYRSVIQTNKHRNLDAAQFGLAYSLLKSNPQEAVELFSTLHEKYPAEIAISVFLAEAEYLAGQKKKGITRLESLLEFNPGNYASSILLAELYDTEERYQDAENVLVRLSRSQEENPLVWYMLAEIHGQAGNIVAVHQTRAQFFILTNRLDKAIEQLKIGIKKATPNSRLASVMQQQLDKAYFLKDNPPF